MYKYTSFYQNIPCGSRVISVFADCSLTAFGRTHAPIIVHTYGFCNLFQYCTTLKLNSVKQFKGFLASVIHLKKSTKGFSLTMHDCFEMNWSRPLIKPRTSRSQISYFVTHSNSRRRLVPLFTLEQLHRYVWERDPSSCQTL